MKKKQQPPKNRTFVLVGVMGLALLTIFGLAIVAAVASQQTKITPAGQTTVVNLRGEIACLPRKVGSDASGQECTLGLKVSDDIYYTFTASAAAAKQNGPTLDIAKGDTISVSGPLTLPADDGLYDVAGSIEPQTVKKQQ